MKKVVEKFLRYVKIDTQSNPNSNTSPSTNKQFDLGKLLVKELKDLGLKNVKLDEFCNVWAELPSNTSKAVPTIGFIAHMDTSSDFSGKNVNPKIIKNYDGSDIVLNKEKNIVLKTETFPEILKYIGEDIITTDGTTLLGADDKAGIAEIITAIEYLVNNPQIEHGTIKIAFTPDEEVGRGTENFDIKKFGVDFAYTVDGGERGELEYENFNAAEAKININGSIVHPGTAKNKMINSMRIAFELDSMLPAEQKPEYTEGTEGFFHLTNISGDIENTKINYIIRDHDKAKFESKKTLIEKIVNFLNTKYSSNIVELELKDQYYNMKSYIEPVMHIIDTAKAAMEELNIEPIILPVRGGTDGAMLSYKGLPTPNLFAGSQNCHGKYEYVTVQTMIDSVNVILKIIEKYTNKE